LLSLESKKKFIAGFIDGDGSCQYSLGINSVQIYSKVVPFILTPFRETLSEFGYVSQKEYRLYLSPEVGKMLKPYTEKKNISSEYNGNVQVELSFELLKNNVPMREIARRLKKDRKTITLALKKVYGMPNIQPFLDAHNKKLKLDRK
jgi:intein/homing endonuclease